MQQHNVPTVNNGWFFLFFQPYYSVVMQLLSSNKLLNNYFILKTYLSNLTFIALTSISF